VGVLVEIRHFYGPEEAYCAQSFLRSLGFNVILQGEHHQSINPGLRIALGGLRLLAPEQEIKEIHFLLREQERRYVRQEAEDDQLRTCDQCGFGEFQLVENTFLKFLTGMIAFNYGVAFAPLHRSALKKCLHCGHRQSAIDD
jgi:hypothetical protein